MSDLAAHASTARSVCRVYVAGPMTGLPGLNFEAFFCAARQLRASGLEVINPAELNPDPATPWHVCMRTDLRQLLTCDGVALLPGWQRSRGALLERHVALELGLLVLELEAMLAHAGVGACA